MAGLAADLVCPQYGSPLEVCRAIVRSAGEFDAVIHEGTWCHVSVAPARRRLAMTAHFSGAGVTYTMGLA